VQLSDARKLDQKTQETLRHRAVLLVEKGATHMEAALAVGVHRGTVSRWCGVYERDGASGLAKGKRGRRPGDRMILSVADARRVQREIRDKMPNQMKLPFALWTGQAVRELIDKKFGIFGARRANVTGSGEREPMSIGFGIAKIRRKWQS
jgi:transposase